MSRIQSTFAALAASHKKGLIPFVPAGDPAPHLTVPLMHALVQAGADILELGVPFSDPMAEGPVIQRACERALAAGVTIHHVLEYVAEFRKANAHTPIVLMGYANPIERMGVSEFVQVAHRAGVDGTIVVDYPPEECAPFVASLRACEMDAIFLLAPTSTSARIAQVAQSGSGFTYYVSLKGVTGAGNIDTVQVAERLRAIRQQIPLPIGVGFGIRDAATACAVAAVADAVVIGSRIIAEMEAVPQAQALSAAQSFLATIRQALDA